MKILQTGDRPTSLAQAIAEIGRADKTIHMLTYLDDENKRRRTLQQLRREGYPVQDEDVEKLSPLQCGHINMQGRYSFTVPESVSKGELRAFNEEV